MREQGAGGQRQRSDGLELEDPCHRLHVRGVEEEHQAGQAARHPGETPLHEERHQQRRGQRVEQYVDDVIAGGARAPERPFECMAEQMQGSPVGGVERGLAPGIEQGDQVLETELVYVGIGDDVPEVVGDELSPERRCEDRQPEQGEAKPVEAEAHEIQGTLRPPHLVLSVAPAFPRHPADAIAPRGPGRHST